MKDGLTTFPHLLLIILKKQYGCEEERICLMPKHEMISDGQDEPVTSMPVKVSKVTKESEDEKEEKVGEAALSDPVLDAPSC